MDIFRCLHKLRHRGRILQWSFAAALVLVIVGWACFYKKPSIGQQTFTCFKNNQVILFFSAARVLTPHIVIPVTTLKSIEEIPFLGVDVQGTQWKIAAVITPSVGDFMAELSLCVSKKYLFPFITFVQDLLGSEYVIVYDEKKQMSLCSVKYLIENCKINQNLKVMISESRNDPISLYISVRP